MPEYHIKYKGLFQGYRNYSNAEKPCLNFPSLIFQNITA